MGKVYLYKLKEPETFKHPLLEGIEHHNEWCSISHGKITIRTGYAWDGCSPKYDVLGLFVIGTPDGRMHEGKRITHDASLVHDVLCQFRHEIPISKEATIQIFSDMLNDVCFGAEPIYTAAVTHLGPQDFIKA